MLEGKTKYTGLLLVTAKGSNLQMRLFMFCFVLEIYLITKSSFSSILQGGYLNPNPPALSLSPSLKPNNPIKISSIGNSDLGDIVKALFGS